MLKLLKPANVHEAIALTVQLDNKHSDSKVYPPKPAPLIKPQPVITTPTAHTMPWVGNLDIKKLSPEEIQRKRGRGECWFCTDKWFRGHKCRLKQLLMLDVVNDELRDCESVELQP